MHDVIYFRQPKMSNIELTDIKYKGDLSDIKYKGDEAPPSYNDGYENQAYDGSHNGSSNAVYTIDGAKVRPDETSTDPADHADSDEDEEDEPSAFAARVGIIQTAVTDSYTKHNTIVWNIIYAVLVLLYAAYFAYAMYYEFGSEASVRLLWVTCFVVFCVIIYVVKRTFGEKISKSSQPLTEKVSPLFDLASWIILGLLFLFFIIFVIVDAIHVNKSPYNLVSGSGIIIYVLLLFIFSTNPAKVKWRPVLWGMGLQFIFALFILRWDRGYKAFEWLGDRVSEFLAHSNAGAAFVFGDDYAHHYFAFVVLPVVIFFSTAVSVLYYMGAMQLIIDKVAWVMQALMGTTAAESLSAAGNIFIGQTEAPLLVRPFLDKMTPSELHAIMTGGFATIAGGVLAAFILFGVPANHLISASVMSAPAALAMAKLSYPETKKSKTTAKAVENMDQGTERNIIEAASAGASASISLVANIAANLIAFLAILNFINTSLTWFGHRVGIYDPPLTFQLISSYLLWPFALIMGVETSDCRKVARMLGVKTFFNEFLAYLDLQSYISNTKSYNVHAAGNGTCWYQNDHIHLVETGETLWGGVMSARSIVISTYALCGFANISSIGIQLGALGAMIPDKKSLLAKIAVRAMIAGNVACFMTACIAGLLSQEKMGKLDCPVNLLDFDTSIFIQPS
jgi:pyrimidine nucleoside transport protein